MDALKQVLHAIRLKPQIFEACTLNAVWTVDSSADCATYYLVQSGQCELKAGTHTLPLHPGDLAVVSNTRSYCLKNASAEPATLLIGEFRAEQNIVYPLFSLLPSLILIENQAGQPIYWLATALQGIMSEVQGGRPGYEAVISRLIDILFIMVMRSWIDQQPNESGGWLSALYDPHIGKSLNVIHAQPDYRWTLPQLAQIAGLSRSAFSQRFLAMVGEPPMRYLTRWRIQLAMTWLQDDPTLTIEHVARRVGYSSPFAFSKAFKRLTGIPPSLRHEL